MWRRAATIATLVALCTSPRIARADASADDSDDAQTTTSECAPDCYIGADGSLRNARTAYRRLTARPHPKFLRTSIEMAMAIGGGAAWYWIDRDRQVADWDFPSLKQRLTFEAWRFDNNPFDINFFWHTFNGLSFHVLSRSNNLSLAQAAGVGLVTSLAWEIGLEFREKVSINDVITTTGAGVAVGEFLHWFGRYINSGPKDNPLESLLRWTLGAPRSAHNALDGRVEYRGETDRWGFNGDIWHQFTVGYGFSLADTSRDGAKLKNGAQLHHLIIDARLAALPGYLRPSHMRKFFAEGNFTSLDVNATMSSHGKGVDARADTMLLGYHMQDIPMTDAGGPGTALTIGADIAYQYRREKFYQWRERLALMHLPGLGIDGHVLAGGLHFRASLRLHADFAGINALSYPAWKQAHPDAVEKTILRKHGYYYAYGGSGRASLELSGRHFQLGASYFYGSYDSKENYDRSQEDVDTDVEADDRVIDYGAWLRIGPLLHNWYFGAMWSRRHREGQLGGVPAEAELDRLTLQLVGLL